MFTNISLQFLDGSCSSREIRPDYTIAQLRADVAHERGIGPLEEVKLIQDVRELKDGDRVNVELQVLIMPSAEKAVDVLEHMTWPCSQKGRTEVEASLALLDLQEDLPELLRERLYCHGCNLAKKNTKIFWDLYDTNNSEAAYQAIYLENLGSVFGRVCGDPKPYLKRLTEQLPDPDVRKRLFPLAAIAQIATRCEHALHAYTGEVDAFIKKEVDTINWGFVTILDKLEFISACRILGQHGDTNHLPLLDNAQTKLSMELERHHCANVDLWDMRETIDGTIADTSTKIRERERRMHPFSYARLSHMTVVMMPRRILHRT